MRYLHTILNRALSDALRAGATMTARTPALDDHSLVFATEGGDPIHPAAGIAVSLIDGMRSACLAATVRWPDLGCGVQAFGRAGITWRTMDEQDRRRAQNEVLFRGLNEKIKLIGGKEWKDNHLADLVCECSSAACMKVVNVSRDDYDAVRTSPTWFIVAPGHEAIDLENVVARYDRYLVVQKRGEAAELAAQTDPRST